jgi:hypothetical protein
MTNGFNEENVIKILTFFIVFLLMSYVLMLCWNFSISEIFVIRKINYFESIAINFICRILFQTVEFEK